MLGCPPPPRLCGESFLEDSVVGQVRRPVSRCEEQSGVFSKGCAPTAKCLGSWDRGRVLLGWEVKEQFAEGQMGRGS